MAFMNEIKRSLDIHITHLDLGGGFGIPTLKVLGSIESRLHPHFNRPYSPPRPDTTSRIQEFAHVIAGTVKEQTAAHNLDIPVLLFEPGRIISGNAELLLARVEDIKQGKNGQQIAIIDAGINNASIVRGEYHEIFVANKINDPKRQQYSIAGPLCTPSDILNHSITLPQLEIGDIIAIMDAGAYFTSLLTNFGYPRPAIIMSSKGSHELIRARETFEHMTLLDKL